MKRRTSVRIITFVLATLGATCAAHAQDKNRVRVFVDFKGTKLTDEQQAKVLEKAQKFYDDAGFGKGSGKFVKLAGKENDQRDALKVTFGPLGESLLGHADKEKHSCIVDKAKIDGFFADPERRCRVYAEVIAHEVGHLLCATHRCTGGGRKGDNNCPGEPTLMSDGRCIKQNDWGLDPSKLSFDDTAKKQIAEGIKMIQKGEVKNWALKSEFQFGVLRLIEGNGNRERNDLGNDEYSSPWDRQVDFQYFENRSDGLFEFGWLSKHGQFIHAFPSELNPDHVLDGRGGVYINFALRGLPGTPFEGQVFPHTQFAQVQLMGRSYASNQARTRGVTSNYYSQAVLQFVISGYQVQVVLDAEHLGLANGFQVLASPVREEGDDG